MLTTALGAKTVLPLPRMIEVPDQVVAPAIVTVPAPVSVALPARLNPPLIWDVAANESDALPAMVSASSLTRLLKLKEPLTLIVGFAAMEIVTSSAAPGIALLDQLPALEKLTPSPEPVQATAARSLRDSRASETAAERTASERRRLFWLDITCSR